MDVSVFICLLVLVNYGIFRDGTEAKTPPQSAAEGTIGTVGSTAGTTIVGTATPAPLVPRFQVKTSAGDVCMILQLNATIKLVYLTTEYDRRQNTLPMTDAADFEGSCEGSGPRVFTLWYPSRERFCAKWTMSFPEVTPTTYFNNNTVTYHKIEPCFESDAGNYNKTREAFTKDPTYEGTIGKTLKCKSLEVPSPSTYSRFLMNSVMLQPFADKSSEAGHFGDVETCPDATDPPPPTSKKPSPTWSTPFNSNWIVAIVAGAVVFLTSSVTLVALLIKKYKKSRAEAQD